MPSFQNNFAWSDGDDFIDEDDIEIVSLLDHHDGDSHQDGSSHHDDKEAAPTIDASIGPTISDNNKKSPPRVQLFGVCAMIGFVLMVATILMSRSSTLSDSKTLSTTANYDDINGMNIISNNNISSSTDKNNNEKSQSIPSSLTTIITTETENTTSINIDTEDQSNEKEIDYLDVNPSSSKHEEDGEESDGIDWFELQTGNSRIDRAYRLAIDELHQNIELDADGSPYFVTNAGGSRSWTRNLAYAIELGAGLVHPDVSRRSLESCTEITTLATGGKEMSATVWYQDTSDHFGGWPNLSDAIVGARGAWHLYLYTGDSTFLEWAYETTLRSLLRAELEALQNSDGAFFKGSLFGGSSSFMGSNSGYPNKYKDNGGLVGKTKALSTNILYYNGYHYAYKMGTILMENNQIVNSLKDRSKSLKNNIRERLWMEEKGSYAYFEDEDGKLVEQMEGLGVALAMLSEDFESDHRIRMIFDNFHRTKLGIPSLWPRYDENKDDYTKDKDEEDLISERYHYGRIWPCKSSQTNVTRCAAYFCRQLSHK